MTFFSDVRESVQIESIAEYCGMHIGRNGKALCPFHDDQHPSLSFKYNRYRCFACGAHGDAIDLVSKCMGLSSMDAAKHINDVFRLGLRAGNLIQQDTRAVKGFEIWEHKTFLLLSAYRRALQTGLTDCAPHQHLAQLHPLYEEAVKNLDRVDAWLDVLTYGTYEEKILFYKTHREEMKKLAGRIVQGKCAGSAG